MRDSIIKLEEGRRISVGGEVDAALAAPKRQERPGCLALSLNPAIEFYQPQPIVFFNTAILASTFSFALPPTCVLFVAVC